MFDEHFADLKPHPTTRYADFVVSDLGGGPTPDASTLIKRFKEEEFPQILVSVNMLDTGFDCPEVVNLVMARFNCIRSQAATRQRRSPVPTMCSTRCTDAPNVAVFDGNRPGSLAYSGDDHPPKMEESRNRRRVGDSVSCGSLRRPVIIRIPSITLKDTTVPLTEHDNYVHIPNNTASY